MLESDDPLDHYHYAYELVRIGRYAEGIQHYEYAISLDPDHLDAEVYVFAAWVLATCPVAGLRNGRRAVEYATKACELVDWLEPWPMVALAAAYAEAGEFQRAAECQKHAIALYSTGYTWLTDEYRQKQRDRLTRYELGESPTYDPWPE